MTEASPVPKTALTAVSSPQAPCRQRRPQGFTEGRYSWLRSRGRLRLSCSPGVEVQHLEGGDVRGSEFESLGDRNQGLKIEEEVPTVSMNLID